MKIKDDVYFRRYEPDGVNARDNFADSTERLEILY